MTDLTQLSNGELTDYFSEQCGKRDAAITALQAAITEMHARQDAELETLRAEKKELENG